MTDTVNLLPCPFCGGPAKKAWIPISMSVPGKTVGGYTIQCTSCITVSLRGADTEDGAILFWNSRQGLVDKTKELWIEEEQYVP